MSESTQPISIEKRLGTKSKAALIVGGTAILLLVAGAAFQVLRPKEGSAGENPAGYDQSGRANTRTAPRTALARVNGELIAYDDVSKECMQRYGQDVLDNLINRTIIHQACQRAQIEITEAEVNEEVVKIAKKFDLDPGNWFRIIESERHLTRRQYLQDVIWPMLALKRLAGTEVQITEEELQKNFVRDYGERVKCRMIMCDKLERAKEAYELVAREPSNFGRVARERSIDPTSKSIDGQIQPIRRFAGNDTVEREAFKLRDGELSGIIDVSTPDGARRFVILLCEGRTTPIVKSIDEEGIRAQVFKQSQEEKTQVAVAKVFERLKKEAQIDNFLTNTSIHGIQQTSGTSGGRDGGVVPASGVRVRNNQTARRPVDQSGTQ
jgi:foldase protein PrsA